jgi:ferrous iron transport protein A
MTSRTATNTGISLSAVKTGEVARIHKLEGGRQFLSRLASLGFTPGAQLQVIQNYGRGPLIVNLRGTRLALGRGEAARIVVKRTGQGDDGL